MVAVGGGVDMMLGQGLVWQCGHVWMGPSLYTRLPSRRSSHFPRRVTPGIAAWNFHDAAHGAMVGSQGRQSHDGRGLFSNHLLYLGVARPSVGDRGVLRSDAGRYRASVVATQGRHKCCRESFSPISRYFMSSNHLCDSPRDAPN